MVFGRFLSSPRNVSRLTVVVALLFCSQHGLTQVELLLPDLIVREDDLYDQILSTKEAPGRTLLRFSNGTANVGLGKLQLIGFLPANSNGTQTVVQRIFRSNGTAEDRLAGLFVYHPEHNHVHIAGWALYRLREILPGNGIGRVITESDKTSFCILDLEVYDRKLAGQLPRAEFRSCSGTVQGLSRGWIDIYDKDVPGQYIDITGLPEGQYWLESEVDPDDVILETDETNNVSRVKITVGDPENAPDLYEPNESSAAVENRLAGAPNSPNLGPVNPKRVIDDLSILVDDTDYFRFYSNHTASESDFVRIDFLHSFGDLDLVLLDADDNEVARSDGTVDSEVISLEGLPEGWYTVHVFGKSGDLNPHYRLAINPPENEPPTIEALAPVGDELRIHGTDTALATWNVTDPEQDRTWVSVFLNEQKLLDATLQALATARYVDGERGFAVINTAELKPGTYFVYYQVTDGGRTAGDWADGTLTLVDFPESCSAEGMPESDCNVNNVLDSCEISLRFETDCDSDEVPDSCQVAESPTLDSDDNNVLDICEQFFYRGDVNDDGKLDVSDPVRILGYLFLGNFDPTCVEAADYDNDGSIVIGDPVTELTFLFRTGGLPPAAPGGPTTNECGVDPDSASSSASLGCVEFTSCD